jgi:hypothetical protein
MIERIIYLQVEARDVDVEIRVNDIPIAVGKRGKQRTIGIPLHEFLLRDGNLLSVEAEAQGQPLPAGAELFVRVASFRDGEPLAPDAGSMLAVLTPSLSPSASTPLRLSAPFNVPAAEAPAILWSWATAPAVAATTSRASLDAYVAYLAALFIASDAEGLLAEFMPRVQEVVLAYPAITPKDAAAAFRERVSAIPPAPDGRTASDMGQVVYRAVANGRMVELLDATGRPFLRRLSDPELAQDDSDLPAMVGIHQGRFRVLR